MDRCMNGWMDGWMDKEERQTGGQRTDRQAGRQTDKYTEREGEKNQRTTKGQEDGTPRDPLHCRPLKNQGHDSKGTVARQGKARHLLDRKASPRPFGVSQDLIHYLLSLWGSQHVFFAEGFCPIAQSSTCSVQWVPSNWTFHLRIALSRTTGSRSTCPGIAGRL